MKNLKCSMIALCALLCSSGFSQNIGINATGAAPDASATLDVSSTAGGMLIPRMTTVQRDAINGGTFANALLIFNTTDNCLQIRNTTSNQWENIYCFSSCTGAPAAPVANAASNIDEVTFTANWSASTGSTTYYLDVDDNSDFSSPLTNYDNINVGNVTSYSVAGLTCGTTYYYRVRAENSCGTSTSSGSITVTYGGSCCRDNTTTVVEVTNPTTGRTWMDRNLGASQAATSSTDALAYGDLYQWGRCADGHEKRASSTTTTTSSVDFPGHSNYITSAVDWRSPKNDNLWQGLIGVNNPCPIGFRLPTEIESNNERLTWVTQNAVGAYGSVLRFPVAGYRTGAGALSAVGANYYHWTSTVSGASSRNLYAYVSTAGMNTNVRGLGLSVRCIKD